MTDHHDELASAYLDGQASPEEAALVEGDPQLRAEVDALATLVERLQTDEAPVDPGVRQRHLSAALAAFDQAAFDQAAPTNVIPLDTAAGRAHRPQPDDMARRTGRVAAAPVDGRRDDGGRRAPGRRQGLPGWLSAAAVLVVVGGGIGWFVSRQTQSDETAAVSVADENTSREAAGDAPLSQATDAGGESASTRAGADAGEGSAGDSTGGAAEAQGAEPGATASAAPLAGATSEGSTTSTTAPRSLPATTPSSGAPVSTTAPIGGLTFSSAPSGADVQDRLASSGQSPKAAGESSCGGTVTAPAGTTLTGYVPITVAGEAGEGLFYRADGGSGTTTVLVVRTSSCQAFS
ncbi:MAG: hypothetical protein R2761_10215 [Acidimicrobiales bacterium]